MAGSDPIRVGPNRCGGCGGNDGEHFDWCLRGKAKATITPREKAKEIAEAYSDGNAIRTAGLQNEIEAAIRLALTEQLGRIIRRVNEITIEELG